MGAANRPQMKVSLPGHHPGVMCWTPDTACSLKPRFIAPVHFILLNLRPSDRLFLPMLMSCSLFFCRWFGLPRFFVRDNKLINASHIILQYPSKWKRVNANQWPRTQMNTSRCSLYCCRLTSIKIFHDSYVMRFDACSRVAAQKHSAILQAAGLSSTNVQRNISSQFFCRVLAPWTFISEL